MRVKLWRVMVAALPPGLTVKQASDVFGRSPSLIRRRLAAFGYQPQSVTEAQVPEWAQRLNWKRPNYQLAAQVGVTRERIRQVRAMLGHPKVEAHVKKRSCSPQPLAHTVRDAK